MSSCKSPDIQIVMPVHNEADCIRSVIMEIYEELASRLQIEFIICEDGSRDGTKEVLRELSKEVPMKLIMSDERKGYSQAMIDGLGASTTDIVLCIDSDGQYVPSDFWKLYAHRKDYDISIGWRHPRRDILRRRLMSRCFKMLHTVLFHVPVHDPSCGFLLVKHEVIDAVLEHLGALDQGFQWEFIARAHRRGFQMREVPLRHQARKSGSTRVYHLHRLPGIVSSHVLGLFTIWWETRDKYMRAMANPVK